MAARILVATRTRRVCYPVSSYAGRHGCELTRGIDVVAVMEFLDEDTEDQDHGQKEGAAAAAAVAAVVVLLLLLVVVCTCCCRTENNRWDN